MTAQAAIALATEALELATEAGAHQARLGALVTPGLAREALDQR